MSVAQQESRQPFEREPNGLVSLEQYREYLASKSSFVPLYMKKRPDFKSDHFMYQHILFQMSSYWQLDLPVGERDRRYRAARELSYSQIGMLKSEEQRLHREKEEDVSLPPVDTVQGMLEDYFDLDLAAASALSIEDIKHPNAVRTEWDGVHRDKLAELYWLSVEDKVGVYEENLEKMLIRLQHPRVLSHEVVASALMRLARVVRHNRFTQAAQERLQDGYYYPLGVPKPGTLRGLGSHMLREAVGITDFETIRQDVQSLQTPVHLVKS